MTLEQLHEYTDRLMQGVATILMHTCMPGLAVQNYATYPIMPDPPRALCPVRRGVITGIRPYARYHDVRWSDDLVVMQPTCPESGWVVAPVCVGGGAKRCKKEDTALAGATPKCRPARGSQHQL